MPITVVPIVIGALGSIPLDLSKWLNLDESPTLQKSAFLRNCKYIRGYLGIVTVLLHA